MWKESIISILSSLFRFFLQRIQTRITITGKATPPMELPTTTPVDNSSEEGDNEDGIRGNSPLSPPKRFNSGFDTEGEGFQIGDLGGNNRCEKRRLRRRRNR